MYDGARSTCRRTGAARAQSVPGGGRPCRAALTSELQGHGRPCPEATPLEALYPTPVLESGPAVPLNLAFAFRGFSYPRPTSVRNESISQTIGIVCS